MESSVAAVPVPAPTRENARGMKGWLKFLGIINIITGALQCLSVIGILFGWLPIWLGVVLTQAGSKADSYARQGDETSLAEFTGKLKSYFVISGVVMIISLAMTVLAMIAVFALLALGVFTLPGLADSLRPGNWN